MKWARRLAVDLLSTLYRLVLIAGVLGGAVATWWGLGETTDLIPGPDGIRMEVAFPEVVTEAAERYLEEGEG